MRTLNAWGSLGPVSDAAFDINEPAWDPSRDSTNERVSLLRELDGTAVRHAAELLDPTVRTVDGRPLGPRRAALLLGCTFKDLEILVNQVNAAARYDDDEELADLTAAITDLGSLLSKYRILKGDLDDAAIERMPVDMKRHARLLQLRIDQLRRQRYDPHEIKHRGTAASVAALRAAVDRAVDDGDDGEATRLQSQLARAQAELDQLRA